MNNIAIIQSFKQSLLLLIYKNNKKPKTLPIEVNDPMIANLIINKFKSDLNLDEIIMLKSAEKNSFEKKKIQNSIRDNVNSRLNGLLSKSEFMTF